MNRMAQMSLKNTKDLKKINLDGILAFKSAYLNEWGYQILYELQSGLQTSEQKNLLKSLEELVIERKRLDHFLKVSGQPVKKTRLKIFQRLCLLSREHFQAEFGRNDDVYFPVSDEEILLETFVKFAMQYNPYYLKVHLNLVVLKNHFFKDAPKPMDFFIRFRNVENISCQSGKKNLHCIQGRLSVFFAITFFIWHMRELHYQLFSKDDKKNELYYLIRSLDISK